MLEKIVTSIKEIVNNPSIYIPELILTYELEKHEFYNAMYTLGGVKKPFDFFIKEFIINFKSDDDTEEIKVKFVKK